MTIDRIILETSHGKDYILAHPEETIAQALRKRGVPVSAVWTYTKPADGHAEFISAESRMEQLSDQPYARISRNINTLGLTRPRASATGTESDDAVTEWAFPDPMEGAFSVTVRGLTQQECVAIVESEVDQVLKDHRDTFGECALTIGTSGGGDSNAMLSAIMASPHIEARNVHPVMMLGIPDWDTQLHNAQTVCENYGLTLNTVDVEDATRIAGVRSFSETRDAFFTRFPDADMEFLATWLLRRVLGGYAKSIGSSTVVIGSNREDILGDGLLRLAQGLPPLTVPFRKVGSTTFVYPLYNVPKKIGDGTHPKFSLENYEARYASHSAGRSVFYHLAYLLSDALPGLDRTYSSGFRKLAQSIGVVDDQLTFDEAIGDYALKGSYTPEQLGRWKAFLTEVKAES